MQGRAGPAGVSATSTWKHVLGLGKGQVRVKRQVRGEGVSPPAAPTWFCDDGVDRELTTKTWISHRRSIIDPPPALWFETHAASALTSLPVTHGTQARTQIHRQSAQTVVKTASRLLMVHMQYSIITRGFKGHAAGCS